MKSEGALQLDAQDFAELAQAALVLNMLEHAQHMLVAAFAQQNGVWEGHVEHVIDDIRQYAVTSGHEARLTAWQKQLLSLDSTR